MEADKGCALEELPPGNGLRIGKSQEVDTMSGSQGRRGVNFKKWGVERWRISNSEHTLS